jgi:hypothetical protein
LKFLFQENARIPYKKEFVHGRVAFEFARRIQKVQSAQAATLETRALIFVDLSL